MDWREKFRRDCGVWRNDVILRGYVAEDDVATCAVIGSI